MSNFKVGEKVIRLDVNSPYIYTIHSIGDGVITIGRKFRNRTRGAWLECNDIRHATDKEITKGYRDD
ncbi:MAG: hypothetical protein RSA09_00050 [Acinetobacter sp.]